MSSVSTTFIPPTLTRAEVAFTPAEKDMYARWNTAAKEWSASTLNWKRMDTYNAPLKNKIKEFVNSQLPMMEKEKGEYGDNAGPLLGKIKNLKIQVNSQSNTEWLSTAKEIASIVGCRVGSSKPPRPPHPPTLTPCLNQPVLMNKRPSFSSQPPSPKNSTGSAPMSIGGTPTGSAPMSISGTPMGGNSPTGGSPSACSPTTPTTNNTAATTAYFPMYTANGSPILTGITQSSTGPVDPMSLPPSTAVHPTAVPRTMQVSGGIDFSSLVEEFQTALKGNAGKFDALIKKKGLPVHPPLDNTYKEYVNKCLNEGISLKLSPTRLNQLPKVIETITHEGTKKELMAKYKELLIKINGINAISQDNSNEMDTLNPANAAESEIVNKVKSALTDIVTTALDPNDSEQALRNLALALKAIGFGSRTMLSTITQLNKAQG